MQRNALLASLAAVLATTAMAAGSIQAQPTADEQAAYERAMSGSRFDRMQFLLNYPTSQYSGSVDRQIDSIDRDHGNDQPNHQIYGG